MKKIAVIGGTGFLGSNFISECNGQFKLRLLTRNKNKELDSDNLEFIYGDLLDARSLPVFLESCKTLINFSYLDGGESKNIEAIQNLIEAAKAANIRRFIHISTAVVVGKTNVKIIGEEAICSPINQYQQVKLAIEALLIKSLCPAGIELIILRPTEIIGVGGSGLAFMVERIRKSSELVNYLHYLFYKNRSFNFVSVQAVAKALIFLINSRFNINPNIFILSDDDNAGNTYEFLESVIYKTIKRNRFYRIKIGISKATLSLIYKVLGSQSSPNRAYSRKKIESIGYVFPNNIEEVINKIVNNLIIKG
jgi:nucleoside-diphosphate-sugar epimerase